MENEPVQETPTVEAQVIENFSDLAVDDSTLVKQAIALSAYLGWISKGALCDIFLLSQEEAEEILQELKRQHIIEQTDCPILRFIKVGQSNNGLY